MRNALRLLAATVIVSAGLTLLAINWTAEALRDLRSKP